jgi:HD-GYP domain-containing protein (c-di-GMP phosphodiesterase class II)
MRQVPLAEAKPGMVLARYIMSSSGKILLAPDIVITSAYIRKLSALSISTIFVKDPDHPDIELPEYISFQTQQRALTILADTMGRLASENTFAPDVISTIASDIVEEILMHSQLNIFLTGILTHDDDTLAHSLNCAIYAAILARLTGFTVTQIKEITSGALLHDAGKMWIDKSILNKPGPLDDFEFDIVRQHPEKGFNALRARRWELSSLVAHMAWQHHERISGHGYPRGLVGDAILPYARILAITDVYEAITVNRPYRRAMSPEEIFKTIAAGLGTEFDSEYGQVFLSKLAIYLPGMHVHLNTGEVAIVASLPPGNPQRPIVRLTFHPDGSPCAPHKEIALADHPHILISSVVPESAIKSRPHVRLVHPPARTLQID